MTLLLSLPDDCHAWILPFLSPADLGSIAESCTVLRERVREHLHATHALRQPGLAMHLSSTRTFCSSFSEHVWVHRLSHALSGRAWATRGREAIQDLADLALRIHLEGMAILMDLDTALPVMRPEPAWTKFHRPRASWAMHTVDASHSAGSRVGPTACRGTLPGGRGSPPGPAAVLPRLALRRLPQLLHSLPLRRFVRHGCLFATDWVSGHRSRAQRRQSEAHPCGARCGDGWEPSLGTLRDALDSE